MRRPLAVLTMAAAQACGGSAMTMPPPVPERSGCYVLGPEATAAPFLFPDTLELAAEWFLPQDSTGGRLRVVRPRDAALATYRTFGGRFWWESLGDSVLVTRSDGVSGAVLAIPASAAEFTAVMRAFGAGYGLMEYVSGRRFPCRGPS